MQCDRLDRMFNRRARETHGDFRYGFPGPALRSASRF